MAVLVRKDGPAGLFQTLRFLAPLRPPGDLSNVYALAFGFALEGLTGLDVTLRRREVFVDSRSRGGLPSMVIE